MFAIAAPSISTQRPLNLSTSSPRILCRNFLIKYVEFLAKKLAKEVVQTQIEIKMDSMNSYERRLVHEVLKDFKGIKTESEGVEPNRCVVIKPSK